MDSYNDVVCVFGIIYLVEVVYLMVTNFREIEFIMLRYVVGVALVLWSLSLSWLMGLLIIVPFCGYVILIITKLRMGGLVINEWKKIVVMMVVPSVRLILLSFG